MRTCIGFGKKEAKCGQAIDAAALALNQSGLWCSDCEKRRRAYLSKQFKDIKESFA